MRTELPQLHYLRGKLTQAVEREENRGARLTPERRLATDYRLAEHVSV